MKALTIEWIKLLRTGNYVIGGLLFFVLAGFAYVAFYQINLHHIDDPGSILGGLEVTEGSIIHFVFVVFICLNIGREYSENTLKRTIIDGYKRDQFYRGKVYLFLFSCLVIYLFNKIIFLTGGLIIGKVHEVMAYFSAQVLINSFIGLLTAGSIAFFLVFLTRSVAVSIIIYFVWNTVEGILINILSLTWDNWDPRYANFFPLTAISNLASSSLIETQVTVVATIYLLVIWILPYVLFLKRDIK